MRPRQPHWRTRAAAAPQPVQPHWRTARPRQQQPVQRARQHQLMHWDEEPRWVPTSRPVSQPSHPRMPNSMPAPQASSWPSPSAAEMDAAAQEAPSPANRLSGKAAAPWAASSPQGPPHLPRPSQSDAARVAEQQALRAAPVAASGVPPPVPPPVPSQPAPEATRRSPRPCRHRGPPVPEAASACASGRASDSVRAEAPGRSPPGHYRTCCSCPPLASRYPPARPNQQPVVVARAPV